MQWLAFSTLHSPQPGPALRWPSVLIACHSGAIVQKQSSSRHLNSLTYYFSLFESHQAMDSWLRKRLFRVRSESSQSSAPCDWNLHEFLQVRILEVLFGDGSVRPEAVNSVVVWNHPSDLGLAIG